MNVVMHSGKVIGHTLFKRDAVMFAEHHVSVVDSNAETEWIGGKLHVMVTESVHQYVGVKPKVRTHPRWTGWEIVNSKGVSL